MTFAAKQEAKKKRDKLQRIRMAKSWQFRFSQLAMREKNPMSMRKFCDTYGFSYHMLSNYMNQKIKDAFPKKDAADQVVKRVRVASWAKIDGINEALKKEGV